MMQKFFEQYKLPLISALAMHGLLLILLGIHWQTKHYTEQASNTIPIIQATTVSADQINPTTIAKPEPIPAIESKPVLNQPIPAVDETLRQREQEKLLQQQAQQKLKQAELEKAKTAALQKQAQLKQQEKIKQAEAEKMAALKQQQVEQAEKLKRAEQAAAFKKEQERLLAQELADEGKALSSTRTSSANQGEIDKYKAMMVQAISRQWLVPDNVNNNIVCKLLIHLAPGGVVLSTEITQSSGNPALDRSAQAAVYKASPLPVPDESNLFDKFRVVSLTVRPEHIQSSSIDASSNET
jgi:colicin import membrane protein